MAPTDNEEERLRAVALKNAQSILLARQRAEEKLRKQSEWLRVTLASIGDGVISTDAESRISFMNGVAESLTGWNQADALGRPLPDVFRIVNEHSRQPVENPALRALREGVIVGLANHTILISKDGKERPIDDSAAPIRNERGDVVGCVLVFRDVTERWESERRQAESESEVRRLLELNQAILANMGEGLYTVDAKGLVTYTNPAAERMFGWTAAELLGRRMHDRTHYSHPDGSPFPIEECSGFQVLHGGATLTDFEDTFIRKDGSFFPVSYCSSPLRAGGLTVGLVVVFRDTTEQKKAEDLLRQNEERLRQLAADLSESNRRKDEFLATLAHELRNPLAPLRNGLEILRLSKTSGPAIDQAVEEARAMMARQLGQMVRLVDDLLDVSRISRGKLELRRERVGLAAVLSNAIETSRPVIEAGGHELTLSLPSRPILVDADVTRLGQVFANLLNNAAKYSERGGHIWLTAERQGNDVVVSVKDTGVGIPREMLPKIFDLFTQVDRSLERSQGGLGIGLTLVKRLVEMHGGTVEARSEGQRKGSEFSVRLPALLSASQENRLPSEGDEPAYPSARCRVLVADDNVDSAASMATMLRIMGYEVRTTNDGMQAVELAATFRPDVILLDIGMPSLNGHEACRRIRAQTWAGRAVFIALTGWGQEDDKRRSEAAGFNYHLVKPVDPAALEKLLASVK